MNARFVVATLLWVVGVTPAMMPAVADAQTPEATISGAVTDATGGALPGVTLTAIHAETDTVTVHGAAPLLGARTSEISQLIESVCLGIPSVRRTSASSRMHPAGARFSLGCGRSSDRSSAAVRFSAGVKSER